MSSESNEIDISPMLIDINKVLKGHLTNILGPMINENNAIHNILLNMPYVLRLKKENTALRNNIIQLKTELNVLKQYYDKELENASKKNVKLEVRDSKSGTPETPSKIVELKQQMWRTNTKVNSIKDNNSMYNGLYGEDDDDDDDDDGEETDMSEYEECNRCEKMNNVDLLDNGSCLTCLEDEKNETKNITLKKLNAVTNIDENGMSTSFCGTILNSQKAGEHATIDTDSDEDECVSAETAKDLLELNKVKQEKGEEVVEEDEEDEEDEDEEDEEDEEEEEEEEEEDEEDEEEEEDGEDEEDEEDEEEDGEDEDEDDDEDDEEELDEEEEEEEEDDEEVSIQANDQEDDDEDMEVEDVEIDGVQYLTTSPVDGKIYQCDDEGEMKEDENGDFIVCGIFKNGIANFI